MNEFNGNVLNFIVDKVKQTQKYPSAATWWSALVTSQKSGQEVESGGIFKKLRWRQVEASFSAASRRVWICYPVNLLQVDDSRFVVEENRVQVED